MNDEADKLKELIGKSKSLVAFTGAGLSSESGIPTYRGINGVWSKYDPAKYASYDYFVTDPSYYWQFFRDVRYPSLEHARPNAAHYFLVELEKRNILKQVITQNIDGLHQLAGQSNVCELHGNTRQIVCMECHKIGGSIEGWFTVAGTVYDDTKTSIFPNATISLTTGPNGTGTLVSSVEVDKKGNFYTTEMVDFGNGLYATVEGNSGINHMNAMVQSGQCNSCHGNSTDRIWTN